MASVQSIPKPAIRRRTRRPGTRLRVRVLPLLTLLTLAPVAAAAWWGWTWTHPSDDLASKLLTATVTRGDLVETISATGSITAQTGAQVKIGSQITGRIKRLYADVGSLVQAGQVIAELDLPDIHAQLDQSKANLARARALCSRATTLLARTTALENVELPLLYGRRKDRTERAIAALERVGLGNRLGHKPNELSGGQQQRVAIARALAAEPRLILADEPTGNLASLQSEEIMQIFQELNDDGITLVMVTHEPEIGRHCKRTVQIRDGRVVEDEPVPDRLRAADVLAQMAAERRREPLRPAGRLMT